MVEEKISIVLNYIFLCLAQVYRNKEQITILSKKASYKSMLHYKSEYISIES